MAAVVKSGSLKRHTKNWRTKGWVDVWVVLKQDSSLLIYKKCGQPQPTWTVNMKEVCQCFTFGQYTDSVPNRPELPPGGQKGNLLAIPEKPRRETKVHWFLPETEAHLHEWMGAIVSTLPPVPGSEPPPPYNGSAPIGFEGHQQQHQQHQHQQQQQPPAQVNVQVIHPQHYPQQQPALYPQQQYVQAPAYPQQQYAQPAAYPQGQPVQYAQQPGQVVVVDGHRRQRDRSNDMAAFVGGAALGMMMSRGHGYYGYGFRSWGSWSSFGSFGSCGSFGSFG